MKSGDWCKSCPVGRLVVYHTRHVGESVTRYLKCDICKKTAGKQIVPKESFRPKRTKHSNRRE